jgi:hypothetical protein
MVEKFNMAKIPVPARVGENVEPLKDGEIESSFLIDQQQLNGAKIYTNREEYIKTFPQNIKFLEAGVAWGYYSELVAKQTNPDLVHLVDFFRSDSRCWSWRDLGECKCEPVKHELVFTPATHADYIKNKFKDYNVEVFQGDARQILPQLTYKYDYIYLDTINDRMSIRPLLYSASELTSVGSIIGLNDYVIYDGVIGDCQYFTYNVVNEFLANNKNWHVDGLALHQLGFYDIYLKRYA